NLFRLHRRKVRKVEAKHFRTYQRPFLLYVFSKYFAQRSVEKVRGRVVVHGIIATPGIHGSVESCGEVRWKFIDKMDNQLILFPRIAYCDTLTICFDEARISYLPTTFGVERGTVKYQLKK